MALSDEVKSRVSLRRLAEGDVVWDVHKSNPKRGDYWAPCPFHGEATASFHVTEPKGTGGQFYCFGCQAKGSCIDYFMAREGVTFTAAVKMLADEEQIDRVADPARQAEVRAQAKARQQEADDEAARKAALGHAKAQAIWRASVPDHPAIAAYLEGRGVRLAAIGGVPPTLRYHPDLPCHEGSAEVAHRGPAMVAFIGRTKLLGVHRTWIDPTDPARGRARFADGRKVPKQMLGRTGEIFGVPTVLREARGCPVTLIVGEGIETTLAAMAASFVRNPVNTDKIRVEAALSLPAMCGPAAGPSGPELGRTGKPLPCPKFALDSDRPGYLPPPGTAIAVILADPSTKCPETARLHALRALDKISPHCAKGARLAVPRNAWGHDDDFADLAQKGDLYD